MPGSEEGTALLCVAMSTTDSTHVPPDNSAVVTRVFDEIIAAIDSGRLQPGDRLSDARFAEMLGVSRTPVREAFQRLREIGLIEASANRFTRVSIVSAQETADALVVWLALYVALLEEVVPTAPDELVAAMTAHHDSFVEASRARDVQRIAGSNVTFFNAATAYSQNAILQYALTAAVQTVRLGGLRLSGPIDFPLIVRAQAMLLAAVRDRDLERALASVRGLRALSIPGARCPGTIGTPPL